jgi:hypothetical protein
MSEHDVTANVLADVDYELAVTGRLDGLPVRTVEDLEQELPELGYYEAALHSLRGAVATEPMLGEGA